jgi:chemotaxis protein MotB
VSDKRPIIIIKKKKSEEHGAHGGAWKLAYADFVTAMMAFFLLLWLLNSTSQEQKLGISYYFEPIKMSTKPSGGGGKDFFGGNNVNSKEKAETNEPSPFSEATQGGKNEEEPDTEETQDIRKPETLQQDKLNLEEAQEMIAKEEEKSFKQIEEKIKKQIEMNADLSGLEKNLIIEETPEGLRIQIIDKDSFSMFSSGSSMMYSHAKALVEMVSHIIAKIPNKITISGHTDSAPFPTGRNYTNWELSTDRANACRRVMVKAGVNSKKIAEVIGKESTQPLDLKDPESSINRRISIVLLHSKPRFSSKKHISG